MASKLDEIIAKHGFTRGDGKTSIVIVGGHGLVEGSKGLVASSEPDQEPVRPANGSAPEGSSGVAAATRVTGS